MKFSFIFVLLVLISGCNSKTDKPVVTAKPGGNGTLVIKQAGYKKDAYIRDAVKKECNLLGKLSQYIEQNASDQYTQIIVNSTSRSSNAQVLSFKIEQVQGGAGGAWSGAKSVLVSGSLSKRGKVIGDFKARRYSGGGMFGAYKGTCAILGRCVKTLGKDIAQWLENPTHKAVLGNL